MSENIPKSNQKIVETKWLPLTHTYITAPSSVLVQATQ